MPQDGPKRTRFTESLIVCRRALWVLLLTSALLTGFSISMIWRFLLGGIATMSLAAEMANAQLNPITSFSRIWGEWDVIPNTQWAPNTVDPSARPERSVQIFKFQPVVPFRLNDDWTVLTRTIFRFASLPTADPILGLSSMGKPTLLDWNQRNQAGLSDISPTVFLVPDIGPNFTIGFGSSLVVPVGDGAIDSGKLSVGPALLAFFHRDAWVVGARMRNVWSVSGDSDRDDVNRMVVRGLIRYQINPDWYLISSPIIAVDWTLPNGQGWIVPLGGGLGRSFRLAGQPMQVSVEAYYNAVKPKVAGEELLGDWTIRTQWQIIFPN